MHELLKQQMLVDHALTSGAFGAGFVCAAVLLPTLGTRPLFLLAGVGALAVRCAAALLLRPAAAPGPMVAAAES